MVHRLVAEAFCDNPGGYTIVDHIDRNKLNNDYMNLRWVSNSVNAKNRENITKVKKSKYIDKITEDFKPVLGFPKYYVNAQGIIVNSQSNRILCGTLRNGYIRVCLEGQCCSAHIVVWEAFNGKVPENAVIDHIDGDRAHNNLDNLRAVSQSDNMYNAQKLGHNGQVSIKQYDKQGNFIKEYNSIRQAAQSVNGNEFAIKQAADRHGSSAGYFWIRNDDNITIEELLKITASGKPKSSCLGVSQFDENNKFIRHYDSIMAAAKAVNCAASTIRKAAAAKRLGKGYYWKIDN